jgi:hypothetical protein
MAVENWKAQNASHFSTATTTTARFHSTKVCCGEKKTSQQSNDVPENLNAQMRP